MEKLKILCPKCSWEPDGKPYWSCSCGMQWDTFSTGGRCPKCGKVWSQTQCVEQAGGCNLWSPHLDWYENLDDISEEAISLAVPDSRLPTPDSFTLPSCLSSALQSVDAT